MHLRMQAFKSRAFGRSTVAAGPTPEMTPNPWREHVLGPEQLRKCARSEGRPDGVTAGARPIVIAVRHTESLRRGGGEQDVPLGGPMDAVSTPGVRLLHRFRVV